MFTGGDVINAITMRVLQWLALVILITGSVCVFSLVSGWPHKLIPQDASDWCAPISLRTTTKQLDQCRAYRANH